MANAQAILSIIQDALDGRRLLRLNYHHYSRLVQPEALDEGDNGELILSGWQLSGGCDSGQALGWKEFRLEEISGASVLIERY